MILYNLCYLSILNLAEAQIQNKSVSVISAPPSDHYNLVFHDYLDRGKLDFMYYT